MGGQLVKNLPSPLVRIGLTDLSNMGGRQSPPSPPPLCVEMGFTWTFHWNQDVTVKLKSELISIKFQQFFDNLANPKLICPIQTILLTCNSKKEAKFEYPLSNLGSFSYFQTSFSLGVGQVLQKPFTTGAVIQNARSRLLIRKWSSYRNKNSFSSRLQLLS